MQSIQAHTKGHPLQRAMFLEFLDDRTTHYLDRQYMLGKIVQLNTE
jgi:alpha-glucosidase (family GH31 glycosyl hydrolase)